VLSVTIFLEYHEIVTSHALVDVSTIGHLRHIADITYGATCAECVQPGCIVLLLYEYHELWYWLNKLD